MKLAVAVAQEKVDEDGAHADKHIVKDIQSAVEQRVLIEGRVRAE